MLIKSTLIKLLALLFGSFSISAIILQTQTTDSMSTLIYPPGNLYEYEWKEIDSLTKQGLYQSASDKNEILYKTLSLG